MPFTNAQKLQIKMHLQLDQLNKELDSQFTRLEGDADAMAEALAALTECNTNKTTLDTAEKDDCAKVVSANGVSLNVERYLHNLRMQYYKAVNNLARILAWVEPYAQYTPQTYTMRQGGFYPI